jgi:hypothetical protein
MDLRRVVGRPGTVIAQAIDGTESYIISSHVEMLDNYGGLGMKAISYQTESGAAHIDLADYDLKPGLVLGRTASGARITARGYVPEDAVPTSGLPGYSIPVVVMAGILSGENGTMRLEALCEDDDYVSTVMLVSDVGLYLRYSGAWWDLPSVDVIDGLNSVEIPEGALDLYDAADQGGRQLHISSFPPLDEAAGAASSEEPYIQAALTDSLVAAATIEDVELPVISTRRELLVAIPVAEQYPSIRWYIEKRRTALEPGVTLPWE